MDPLDKELIKISNYKTKAIHTDLTTFRYNQAYSGIIQA